MAASKVWASWGGFCDSEQAHGGKEIIEVGTSAYPIVITYGTDLPTYLSRKVEFPVHSY